MKLFAKICHEAMEDILSGEKTVEYRTIESLTLKDTETGQEYEYEVQRIRNADPTVMANQLGRYGIPYEPGHGNGVAFVLGDLIRKKP